MVKELNCESISIFQKKWGGFCDDKELIFVIAPSYRCGTTLIQRLLNSTRKIVIFGEDVIFINSVSEIMMALMQRCIQSQKTGREVVEHFLNESTDFWSNDLLPDPALLLYAGFNWLKNLVEVYGMASKNMQCERWGMKLPLRNFKNINFYHDMFPKSKLVFIYRDLFEVAKSAKARKFISTPREFVNLANAWKENCLAGWNFYSERIYHLPYAEIKDNPKKVISDLESFCSVEGIDTSVLDRKINTWPGDEKDGKSSTGYIEPEELSEMEVKILYEYGKIAIKKMEKERLPKGFCC